MAFQKQNKKSDKLGFSEQSVEVTETSVVEVETKQEAAPEKAPVESINEYNSVALSINKGSNGLWQILEVEIDSNNLIAGKVTKLYEEMTKSVVLETFKIHVARKLLK